MHKKAIKIIIIDWKREISKKYNKDEQYGIAIEVGEVLIMVTEKDEKKIELKRVEYEEKVRKLKCANNKVLSKIEKKQEKN